MVALMIVAVVLAVLPLVLILANLIIKGAGSLSVAFFTQMPVPMPIMPGESSGGVLHAIGGTVLLIGMASLIGVPIGIAAGLYCTEYRGSKLAWITRFVSD